MSAFVTYNPTNTVPTTAAAQFARDLIAVGHDVYNFGIGKEGKRAPAILFPDTMTVTHGPDYNADIGGSDKLRANVAHYLCAFLGIAATSSNTFVVSQNGRVPVLHTLMFLSAQRAANEILLPVLRWPTYDAITKLVRGLSISTYENPVGDTIDLQLQSALQRRPLAMVVNTPHNPTGAIYTAPWMKALADKFEQANESSVERTALILDNPYFYALPDAKHGESHRLDGGYEHVTKLNSITPWVAVVSLSKALGMASPGLSLVSVHPSLADDFRKMLLLTGGGSYNLAFYEQAEKAFASEMFPVHETHYRGLRSKYEANFAALNAEFGNHVVAGGPGMTALVELPELLGRTIVQDGHTYDIRTTGNAVECLGNMTGVVVVDQGVTSTGAALIRIAAAAEPQRYASGIAKLRQAIGRIQESPRLAG